MDESKQYILKEITKIYKDTILFTEDELKIKYNSFVKKYPKLFKECVNLKSEEEVNDFFEKLKYMLNKRNEIKSGASKFDIGAKVSDNLAKEYVYPKFGEPDSNTKQAALEQLKKKTGGEYQ